MSVTAFVLVWVGVALAIFLFAITGGRLSGKSLTTRRSRKLTYTGFGVVIVGLAVGIPTATVVVKNGENNVASLGINLTDAQENGRIIFGERCKNCHTMKAAAAVAQVGPNLDQLVGTLTIDQKKKKGFVLDTIRRGVSRGNGQMAAGLVQGKDADDVAAFVASAAGQS